MRGIPAADDPDRRLREVSNELILSYFSQPTRHAKIVRCYDLHHAGPRIFVGDHDDIPSLERNEFCLQLFLSRYFGWGKLLPWMFYEPICENRTSGEDQNSQHCFHVASQSFLDHSSWISYSMLRSIMSSVGYRYLDMLFLTVYIENRIGGGRMSIKNIWSIKNLLILIVAIVVLFWLAPAAHKRWTQYKHRQSLRPFVVALEKAEPIEYYSQLEAVCSGVSFQNQVADEAVQCAPAIGTVRRSDRITNLSRLDVILVEPGESPRKVVAVAILVVDGDRRARFDHYEDCD